MTKYIGLSFSKCIADIARGFVAEDDVVLIVAETCEPCSEKIIDFYARVAWVHSPNKEKAVSIARRLFEKKKVKQPRLNYEKHPGHLTHHWIDADTNIAFFPSAPERSDDLQANFLYRSSDQLSI